MRARTTTLAAILAIALLGLALVASGCGPSSSEDGVAALEETAADTTTTETPAEDDEETDPQEAALTWARCMREHGIDVPDPDFSGGPRGAVRVRGPGAGLGPGNEKFREAQKACGRPFGRSAPPLAEEDREQLQEAFLAFAKCMREHGIDMPDPQFGSGNGGFTVRQAGRRMNPDSAQFRAAEKECSPVLRETEEKLGIERPGS